MKDITISIDGWDVLLIAIAIVILWSVFKDSYKTWKKRKDNPYKYTDEKHDITVWLPDETIAVHEGATEVDIRDRYICISFEDGTDIEYEGVTFKVITRKI